MSYDNIKKCLCGECAVKAIEDKVFLADSVTIMMEDGKTPEQILEYFLADMDLKILEKTDVQFHCDCSKERVARALATISKKDLDDIINDGEEIEVKCHFCNSAYKYSVDEIKALRKDAEQGVQTAQTEEQKQEEQ